MYDLLIFDVDGLLLDTERVWFDVWNQVSKERNLPELHNIFINMIGSNRETETVLLNGILKDPILVEEIFDQVGKLGLSLLGSNLKIKKGVFEILEYGIENGYKIGLATSTNREHTIERLKRVNIIKYFDYILCGDEVKKMKPDPEIYTTVLNHFKVNKKRALVFEDSYVGVEAAFNAGISCIMVEDIAKAREIERKQTAYICNDLLEALDFLKRGEKNETRT